MLVGRLESHHDRAKLISLSMCLLSGTPLMMSDQPSGSLHRLESLGDRAGLTWILMGSETIYKGRSYLEDHWLHQMNILVYNRKGQSFCESLCFRTCELLVSAK